MKNKIQLEYDTNKVKLIRSGIVEVKGLLKIKGFRTCILFFYIYFILTLMFKGIMDYPMINVIANLLDINRSNNLR